jgi:hypothetical protein
MGLSVIRQNDSQSHDDSLLAPTITSLFPHGHDDLIMLN